MYTERRKYYPPFSKSLDEEFTQLKQKQHENSFMSKCQQFIYIPDNQLFICLTTIKNMEFMTCSEFFAEVLYLHLNMHRHILFSFTQFIVLKMAIKVPVVYFFLMTN